MIYPITKYGQPVLEERGAIITEFDTPELNQLIEDMFESMYAARGVGSWLRRSASASASP